MRFSRFLVTKSAAKVIKESVPLSLRALPPQSRRRQPTHCVHWFIPRVHELVARAMRGKCVRQGSMAKIGSFVFPTVSAIPRVRTCHTKEPSRFVHALSPHTQIRATASPVFAFFRAFILNCPRDLDDGDAGRSGNCTCCRICRKCCRRHCYLIR